MLHDDPIKNPETGKNLTPEELRGLIKVSEKLQEKFGPKPKSDDGGKGDTPPWDGS